MMPLINDISMSVSTFHFLTIQLDQSSYLDTILCEVLGGIAGEKVPLGKSDFYPLITNIHKNLLSAWC